MAHDIQSSDFFAYVGEKAWHGIGTEVSKELNAVQAANHIGLNWEPVTYPTFAEIPNGERIATGKYIVRSDNGALLESHIPDDWHTVKNSALMELADRYINEHGCNLSTIFTTGGGKAIAIALKTNQHESIGNKLDIIQNHMLLYSVHQYGKAVIVKECATRSVCANTIAVALNEKTEYNFKFRHNSEFDVNQIATTLKLGENRFQEFIDKGNFLASKAVNDEEISIFLAKLFPIAGKNLREKEFSRPHKQILDVMETQPGADMGAGTWWQVFNAVTYSVDHFLGHEPATRIASANFGIGAKRKLDALNLALEMAA